MIKFLADENIPPSVVGSLRGRGFDVKGDQGDAVNFVTFRIILVIPALRQWDEDNCFETGYGREAIDLGQGRSNLVYQGQYSEDLRGSRLCYFVTGILNKLMRR